MSRGQLRGMWAKVARYRAALALAVLAGVCIAVAATPGFGGQRDQSGSLANDEQSGRAVRRFSDPPTDDEIRRSGVFMQPLLAVGPTTADENRTLASLITTYAAASARGDVDAVEPFVRFVAERPRSPWSPALQLDIGAAYRRTGHFSKALATWQAAWDTSKGLTDPNGRIVGDAAAAYLSQFEAYLGRKETLAPLLQELKSRPVRGTSAELISSSSDGLADMLSSPGDAFKCGPSALSRILTVKPTANVAQSRRVLDESKSTPQGLSLTAVQAISAEAGMGYQMAFRSPGAPLVMPAVTHWKVGHYAALMGKSRSGRLLVGDPTFGEDIQLAQSTLDEEASGYFLVGPGPLPAGWRSVDAAEGSTVWGRGDTGQNHDTNATGPSEIQAFPGGCGGCTSWNVEASLVGLSMRDDPVGYKPPIGPEMRFPMWYSQRDTQQPPTGFTYTNFGNKWTTGWLSYVTDDAQCAGFYGSTVWATPNGQAELAQVGTFCAQVYRRGGGSEPYVYPGTTGNPYNPSQPSTSTTSPIGQFSQATLTRTTNAQGFATQFVRTLPDGSTELRDPLVCFLLGNFRVAA